MTLLVIGRRVLALLLASAVVTAQAFSLQRQRDEVGRAYTVATVNLQNDQLRLHWLNPTTGAPYLTFSQLRERLRKEGDRALFLTNSGIYAPEFKPLGLHIEAGREVVGLNHATSGGNFALLPNGVFWIDGKRAGVTETGAYARAGLRPQYATQSGPLLVSDGALHPAFNRGSSSRKLRSGVGVCEDGKIRFVVSRAPVNFYTFATYFRDTLRCPDALYLDGTISAYAGTESGGWTDTQWTGFAGIWSVVERER